MAMNYVSSNVVPKSHIEAIQTVPPNTVTDPRQVWKVSAKDPIGSNSIFKGALNIIFYFNKCIDDKEDSGWVAAGWMKESLGIALRDQPLLSGRLRRGEDGVSDLEIVSNDSGVRLLDAKIDMTLKDFLDLKDVEKDEAQLVYWKDIDEITPQFSPLFYVQVTNFQCGGYSIGISCCILVADILIMENFLQKWAKIHKDIVPKNKESELPIFYLPNLKPANANLSGLSNSTSREKISQTLIYKISSTSEIIDLKENLAHFCLEEAHKISGISHTNSSEFAFLVKESPRVIKAQNWKKCETGKPNLEINDDMILKTSDLKEYLGINEVSFREGSKAAMVSYWIGTGNGEAQAIAIPSYDKLGDSADLNVIITIPFCF